ncbi:MAG: acyl-CoA dehydrogenase family protein [Thermodesulfobacteriota bacterium]|nr:acyl-CoA dehydrogenase family protein [Thermodesulfobacteriota bacterium]
MDFSFTKEEEKFRRDVREFLESEIKKGTFTPMSNAFMESSSSDFSRLIAEKGWIGLTWPKKYGGKGSSFVVRTILIEELLRYRAPLIYHFVGERQMGPALMHFASEELKDEFLPKIKSAQISFCIGISEPDAGSDVSSVSTYAREEGDYYIINGQKIWTTHAHNADYIWVIALTDQEGPSYKNLSEIIVDLKSPGVTIRPLYNMTGKHSFNEVFFDNVKIHKKYLVGEKNRGFYQMMSQVDYERSGIERLMQNYHILEMSKAYIKENKTLASDPVVREQMAQFEIEFEVGRLLCYRVAWTVDQGIIPNLEAAISKAFCTRYEQRLGDFATHILGQFGQVLPGFPDTPLSGEIAESYLWNPSYTMQGGTTEVLKTIIATRGLGLKFKKK